VPQVVVLGDVNVDFIAHLPFYPQPGGESVARRTYLCSGGSAANTALVLARCGVQVGLMARVGRDALAAKTLMELTNAGVDDRQIQYDSELVTGMIFVAVTPDGERTMFSYRGANARLEPALLQPAEIACASVLHVSGYALLESPQRDAALQALDIARQAGLKVSLDVGIEAAQSLKNEVRDLLPVVDWILPNELEAKSLMGYADRVDVARTMEWFLSYGLEAIVLKLGGRGCVLGTPEGILSIPAFDVGVRDTTGAGDSFNAGFIAGRLGGLSWGACGLLANALGGLAASVDGAGASLPGPADVIRLLDRQRGEERWQVWQEEVRAVRTFLGQVASGGCARTGTQPFFSQALFSRLFSWQGGDLDG